MNVPKKIFLLDAYALIYRAYFAFIKNPRINSKGVDTSAVFGFTNTLIEVIKKENPTHLAVVFDTKEPTQRHIEYPQYKAHREAMPEPLRDSLPYIDKLLEALNIPKLFKSGFEADDIVGTLAKQAEKEGFQVYMMTSDKDFAQLVSENIFMYRPGNKWKPTEIWGVKEVLENFQIQKVEQVIDYLGMMGDSADNIPGIPGIGKKTAQKFIAEFGSMEGLFSNTDKLKGKLKEKVEQAKEIGFLSKKLVTINTNVPVIFDANQSELKLQDNKQLKALFEELEFRTLLSRILELNTDYEQKNELKEQEITGQIDLFTTSFKDETKELKPHSNVSNYTIAETSSQIEELVEKLIKKDQIAIQVCTTDIDFHSSSFIGVAFCFGKEESVYVPLLSSQKDNFLNLLEPIFKQKNLLLLGYDLKNQLKHLKYHELNNNNPLFDIAIAHYLLHPDMRHSLDLISENKIGKQLIDIKNLQGKGKFKKQIEDLKTTELMQYTCEHADACFQLYIVLKNQLLESNVDDLFMQVEMPLTKVLVAMEMEGIRLDDTMLNNYAEELEKLLKKCIEEIHLLADQEFNISSPKQLGEILFKKMQLAQKPKKTKSGQYSTSEETLLKLKGANNIIDHILDYREIKKLLSTYVESLPNLTYKNRIHTTFNQSIVATGRLSSANPNLQNIPIRSKRGKKIRESFIPKNKDYFLLSADYSQIELRIMAALSKDNAMTKAFQENQDIHIATASKVYKVPISSVTSEMRSKAKAVNFGIIYGISAFGLSQNIGISRTEAKKIIDDYFLEFPKIKKFIAESISNAREKEYVTTIFGRKRFLRDINSRNSVSRAVAERNAINTPIQGSAADIIKKAMINIEQEIKENKLKSRMLIQVHDELVFDIHKNEQNILKTIIRNKMENVVKLEVPLIVDIGIGENWLQAH